MSDDPLKDSITVLLNLIFSVEKFVMHKDNTERLLGAPGLVEIGLALFAARDFLVSHSLIPNDPSDNARETNSAILQSAVDSMKENPAGYITTLDGALIWLFKDENGKVHLPSGKFSFLNIFSADTEVVGAPIAYRKG